MVNRTLKALVLLLAQLVLTAGVWAADVTFKVTPLVRTNWGLLQEYVFYDNDSNGTPEYTMSRLDWDIVHYPTYGGLLSFDIRTSYNHTFHINASYILGSSLKSGQMQDYDWYHLEPDGYCGALTNYSCHTNHLNDFMDVSLSGGWTLPHGFGLNVGWDIRKLSFAAKGGYGKYGNTLIKYVSTDHVDLSMEPNKTWKDNEDVITYEYLCNYLKIGLTYTLKKARLPELYCGVWGIPLYAAQALDRHLERSENFLDVMYGYNCGLTETVALSFPLSATRCIYIREDGEIINTVKGDTYSSTGEKMPSTTSKSVGWGGSSRKNISLTVGYTLAF